MGYKINGDCSSKMVDSIRSSGILTNVGHVLIERKYTDNIYNLKSIFYSCITNYKL